MIKTNKNKKTISGNALCIRCDCWQAKNNCTPISFQDKITWICRSCAKKTQNVLHNYQSRKAKSGYYG